MRSVPRLSVRPDAQRRYDRQSYHGAKSTAKPRDGPYHPRTRSAFLNHCSNESTTFAAPSPPIALACLRDRVERIVASVVGNRTTRRGSASLPTRGLENKQTISDVNNLAGATDVRISPAWAPGSRVRFEGRRALLAQSANRELAGFWCRLLFGKAHPGFQAVTRPEGRSRLPVAPYPAFGRCERTRRNPGTGAASLGKPPGGGAATSGATTRSPRSC